MFVFPQHAYVETLPSPPCDPIRRWGLWEIIKINEVIRTELS